MTIKQKTLFYFWVLIFNVLLTACTNHNIQKSIPLSPKANWVILPIANYSDNPDAEESIADLVATQLRAKYRVNVIENHPPSDSHSLPEFNQQKQLDDALQWASGQSMQYGLSGSVQEWHYKNGLDAEPAVGITLKVYDIKSGKIVWSASGSKTGWGFSNLSKTGQTLIAELLDDLPIIE